MPAPKRPNTEAATNRAREVAVRRGDETAARRLREHGWLVVPPERLAELSDEARTAVERHNLAANLEPG